MILIEWVLTDFIFSRKKTLSVVSIHLAPFKREVEGDLSNKISPNPSFSKRGLNSY